MLVRLRIRAEPVLLTAALQGLVAVNRVLLRSGNYPALYRAGVRYVPEPRGSENWQSIDGLYRARRGDCEDLACARAAELQVGGELRARAIVRRSGKGRYHALVQRADGTLEDPSIVLGMKVRR